MRIANVPKRPTDLITNDELLHDLLLVMKDVVAFESTLAKPFHSNGNGNGNGNELHLPEEQYAPLTLIIQKITDLNSRLKKRNLDIDQALVDASPQLGLDLRQLLHDCLRFPHVIPYARNLKGLRRLFLCHCGEREMVAPDGLGLCLDCLESALECLQEKKRNNKYILYSSYSPQVRCRHADFSTLLITLNKPGIWPPSWCEICLKQEKLRLVEKGFI